MHPDPELDKYLDGVIAKIAAAQEPDGYLYTARRLFPRKSCRPRPARSDGSNREQSRALQCRTHVRGGGGPFPGHGEGNAPRCRNPKCDFLCRDFRPANISFRRATRGLRSGCASSIGPLAREVSGFGEFLIDVRGRPETHKLYGPLPGPQAGVGAGEAVGHAVRAAYLYSGMADVAALTGDEAYLRAIDRLWENVVFKKTLPDRGIGASHGGEAFGTNYELPNNRLHETCAAIANGFGITACSCCTATPGISMCWSARSTMAFFRAWG